VREPSLTCLIFNVARMYILVDGLASLYG